LHSRFNYARSDGVGALRLRLPRRPRRTGARTARDANERAQIDAVIMRQRNRMDAPIPAFRAAIDDAKMISAGQRWGNRTSVNSHPRQLPANAKIRTK